MTSFDLLKSIEFHICSRGFERITHTEPIELIVWIEVDSNVFSSFHLNWIKYVMWKHFVWLLKQSAILLVLVHFMRSSLFHHNRNTFERCEIVYVYMEYCTKIKRSSAFKIVNCHVSTHWLEIECAVVIMWPNINPKYVL